MRTSSTFVYRYLACFAALPEAGVARAVLARFEDTWLAGRAASREPIWPEVVLGETECHLCNRVMDAREDLVLFPPAVLDPESDMAHLDDTAVHLGCLVARPEGARAKQVLDEVLAQ